ncbi:MAG: 30S ribosomal protein S3, partial [Thermoplasmatota archaeon]
MVAERKLVVENIRRVLLKEYIMKETEKAGFGGLDIQRTPMGTRITLVAERPGMIIGQRGSTIKDLTEVVESRFRFDNPQIEVMEDPNPSLNPHIMAQKLASAIERGWHFRRAGHSTVRRIMEAGAKGCQVVISGKLTGERHRTEKFREGHIKYCGEPKNLFMKTGFAVAKKKPGIIGIKVQIMLPDTHLPDEIDVIEPAASAPEPSSATQTPAAPRSTEGGAELAESGKSEQAAPEGGAAERPQGAAGKDRGEEEGRGGAAADDEKGDRAAKREAAARGKRDETGAVTVGAEKGQTT